MRIHACTHRSSKIHHHHLPKQTELNPRLKQSKQPSFQRNIHVPYSSHRHEPHVLSQPPRVARRLFRVKIPEPQTRPANKDSGTCAIYIPPALTYRA